MPDKKIYLKQKGALFLLAFLYGTVALAQSDKETYKLVKTITGKLSPKSISNNGDNLFFAQNMMYNHSITVYDSSFNLVSTISDNVKPAEFGYKDIKGSLSGGPVESAATKDGKYIWVSNYNMSGEGFANPGCDTCYGSGYDASFVYKINTGNYKIESIVKVGSVPKYLTITPDQKKLIVSNWSSGNVSVIDLATEKEIKRVNVGPAPRGIACDSTSTFAYIALMGCNRIISINLNTYQTETLVSGIRNPRHLCIDKNYLYASLNGEQAICRINLADNKMQKLTVGRAPRSMAISLMKNKLYVDCYEDSKIAVIDLTNFTLETTFKTNGYPIGICLSKDNDQLWVSCYSGSIQIFSDEGAKKKKPESLAIQAEKKADNIYPTAVILEEPMNAKSDLPSPLNQDAFKKPARPVEVNKYYVVLGSFSIKENALNLKSKLLHKGIDIELIDSKKGFTYCACKAKNDKEGSEKLISELQNLTGIKGWLYSI